MAIGFKTLDERPDLLDRFSLERTMEVLTHPRLPDALRHSAEGALAMNRAEPEMSAALKDIGRFWAGLLCLYLHSTPGGMTLGRLREACVLTGFMSPNAAEALLAHLRDIGFVVPMAEQPDRRTVQLETAPRLIEYFRRRNKIEIGSAALLDPALQPLVDAWEEFPVMEAFNVAHGADLVAAGSPGATPPPNLNDLFAKNAGVLMLMRMMVGAEQGDTFPPRRPVRLSMNALAQEFAVSRIHVSRFIASGEGMGFLVRSDDQRSVRFTELYCERYELYFGHLYLQWMGCREQAEAVLAERAAAGA